MEYSIKEFTHYNNYDTMRNNIAREIKKMDTERKILSGTDSKDKDVRMVAIEFKTKNGREGFKIVREEVIGFVYKNE